MATVYAVRADQQYNTNPPDKVIADLSGGRCRYYSDTYEFSATAAGEIVRFFKLPKGTIITEFGYLRSDDLGTGNTLDLILDPVDGSTDVELVVNIDSATAAAATSLAAIGSINTFPYEVTADSWLAIETADAATTGTVKLGVVLAGI